ncbi:hypothetical protein [Kutzneria sp. CA-103260]|uniref:hypothetical protein n=1 Tax=Kutzneria sp. CA-103260 TaxID=2802641 RepID=UPI001BF0844C|nr:hypothetical protein [Kutzneria sp. CA-103260]QUQ71113.1 hypothetical protein JJ691_88960 [Kutzneria sp. CA-103260]
MPKTVVGIIAATLVAAVLGVAGVSTAAAQSSNPTLAQQVQQGRDRLAAAWQAQDVAALKTAVSELNPVLAAAHGGRDALSPDAAMYLARAEQQRDQLATALYAPQPRSGILDSVTGLVSGLLDSLSNLLSNLLGGGGGHDSGSGGTGGNNGGGGSKPTTPAPTGETMPAAA